MKMKVGEAVKMQNQISASITDDFDDARLHGNRVGAAVNGARHHFVQKKRHLKGIMH
jgi:hypothetical protein